MRGVTRPVLTSLLKLERTQDGRLDVPVPLAALCRWASTAKPGAMVECVREALGHVGVLLSFGAAQAPPPGRDNGVLDAVAYVIGPAAEAEVQRHWCVSMAASKNPQAMACPWVSLLGSLRQAALSRAAARDVARELPVTAAARDFEEAVSDIAFLQAQGITADTNGDVVSAAKALKAVGHT